jgi:hypothetical protein
MIIAGSLNVDGTSCRHWHSHGQLWIGQSGSVGRGGQVAGVVAETGAVDAGVALLGGRAQ